MQVTGLCSADWSEAKCSAARLMLDVKLLMSMREKALILLGLLLLFCLGS